MFIGLVELTWSLLCCCVLVSPVINIATSTQAYTPAIVVVCR